MRSFLLSLPEANVDLPCFFPSVSSVKTNLLPVDYIELLGAAGHPQFLVSAYDVSGAKAEQRARIDLALSRSRKAGSAILIDSGNYEAFWKHDRTWTYDHFHRVIEETAHQVCFSFDNQSPPSTSREIALDVAARTRRDQNHTLAPVAPIIHGEAEQLPLAARAVAEQLSPSLLAVPERLLGNGVLARIQTVQRIRRALEDVGYYCVLHLLGTGNPLSIALYSMAGADSFDGLEWCQTVVDHDTGRLSHFQHWDLFREQTVWGANDELPYTQAVLMHNLEFYRTFMSDLRSALLGDATRAFLGRYTSEAQVALFEEVLDAR